MRPQRPATVQLILRVVRSAPLVLVWSALASLTASAAAPAAAPTVIATIDLSQSFGTRSAWRFTATQAPPVSDPIGVDGEEVPGAVTVCLRKAVEGPCDPQLLTELRKRTDDDFFSEPHYLDEVKVVHAQGTAILLVVTASLHSVDGDQVAKTQALAYEAASDRFTRVYEHTTGRNNNQEVRFVEAGPLAGDIISVEPAENAPFGFWISVNALTRTHRYEQRLRYRSATIYGDGNPLPVIESEMANIQQRLGLWRAGSPLPLPATPCPKPHLIRMELWCG